MDASKQLDDMLSKCHAALGLLICAFGAFVQNDILPAQAAHPFLVQTLVVHLQMAAGSSKPGQMRQTQHSESEPRATIYEAQQQTAEGVPAAVQQAEGAHRAQNALPSKQPRSEAAQHAAQHAEAGHSGQGQQIAGAAQPAAQQPNAQCAQQAAQQGEGRPPVQAGPSGQSGQGGHRAEADQATTQQVSAQGAQQAGQHGETGHSGRAGQAAHSGQGGQRAGAAQPAAHQPGARGTQLSALRRARSATELIYQTAEQEQRAAARAAAAEAAEQERAQRVGILPSFQ